MDRREEPEAPWFVRFMVWQHRRRAWAASLFLLVFFPLSLIIGLAATSCLWTLVELYSAWRFRAWLRERIRATVAEHGEIPARQVIVRLAPVVGSGFVRTEIGRLVSEGYLDERAQGVLTPAVSF